MKFIGLMGGQMVIKDDEWDELAINKNRRRSKKKKFKNLEHQKDAEFSHFEENIARIANASPMSLIVIVCWSYCHFSKSCLIE